jgi:hypothetical protein
MTTTVIAGIAGAILSLFLKYVPGFRQKWALADANVKRFWMIFLLILAGALVYGAACAGFLGPLNWNLTCDANGLDKVIRLVFAAASTNQITYLLAPEKKDVLALRDANGK